MLYAWILAATALAPAGGTNFLDLSWEDALKEAKKADKLVFVDFYTGW